MDVEGLRQRLSSAARIHLPDSEAFETATSRRSQFGAPKFAVVVVPSTERDVAEAVKFANDTNAPFLAVSTGLGALTNLAKLRDGVQIWMKELDGVEISEDGTTAKIGGGALTVDVRDRLWDAGKQTVTGVCEGVGYVAPGLGGGFGPLQGRHGLVADQWVSMNVVLADGSMRTISEGDELWWAMRGAGHNFGIVTSVTAKIHEIEHRVWALETMAFSGQHVKRLYELVNRHLLKDQPVDMMHWSAFVNNQELNPEGPVIRLGIIQEGRESVDPAFTQPFHELGPIVAQSGLGTYRDLPTWIGGTHDSVYSAKAGLSIPTFPISLLTYNPDAQQRMYDHFASVAREYPVLDRSTCLFQSYPSQGVRAVPSDSTAFPFRDNKVLISPMVTYRPDGPELDQKAAEFGEGLRQISFEGGGRDEKHVYINTAFGDEDVRSWYGYEGWRLDRLRALKEKYDPHGRLTFFASIV